MAFATARAFCASQGVHSPVVLTSFLFSEARKDIFIVRRSAVQPSPLRCAGVCVCRNPAASGCTRPVGSGSVTAVAEVLLFDLISVKLEQPRVDQRVSGCALLRSPGRASGHVGFATHVFGNCSVGPYCSLFSHSVTSDSDPMDCSTPGLPVHYHLPELVQTSPSSR